MNLHVFVINNPIRWRDAWGLELEPVPPHEKTIVCKGEKLVPQIPKIKPDHKCSLVHEQEHIKDWEDRYGKNLCVGVKDGFLPVDKEGYEEFRRQSECKAYKAGLKCREELEKTCPRDDLGPVKAGIRDDKAYLRDEKNGCK